MYETREELIVWLSEDWCFSSLMSRSGFSLTAGEEDEPNGEQMRTSAEVFFFFFLFIVISLLPR